MTTPDARDEWERTYQERKARTGKTSASPGNELVSAGIACAILLPVVGLIIGVVLLFKDRVGPGLGCIMLSVAAMVVYYALLASFA